MTLALAIGANTAVFSLVNTLMLRRLPVHDPGSLVELVSHVADDPPTNAFAWRFYEHYRDHNDVFSDLIGTSPARIQLTRPGRAADAVDGEYVVGRFFSALGVRAALGRLLTADDDQPGRTEAAVVLSWSSWRQRFGQDPAVVGSPLIINGRAATIVGVAGRSFTGVEVGTAPEIWVPVAANPELMQRPAQPNRQVTLKLLARLKTGVSIAQATAAMSVLDRRRVEDLAQAFGNPLWLQARITVEPAAAGLSTLRTYYGRPVLAVMAIVALLSLVACTNVASLLLARGAARQREMAVRVALGARRSRLIRQLLTESALLSAAAAALGLMVAYVATRTLVRIITSGRPIIGLPERLAVTIEPDVTILVFTIGLAGITAVLFGLAPAWHALASAAVSSLRGAGTSTAPKSRRRVEHGLVVAQIALSLVLLSGAALLVRHLASLRNDEVGFNRESVLLVALNPQGSGLDGNELARRYEQLLGRIQTIPGVRSATVSGVTPIQGAGAARFARVDGFVERAEDKRYVSLNWIGPRYFETLGTPLVSGRDFTFDDAARSRVAIVNQAFAHYYFAGSSALGRHVSFERDDTRYEIVGVVGDAKYLSLHRPAPRTVYINAFQEPGASQFAIRTTVHPPAVASEVRRAVADVVPTVRVSRLTTLEDQVDASVVPERLMATLSTFFAALGILLAAVGVYGLLAYTVARRTTEIGVRMALGATERDVVRMVLRTAALLVGGGLVIGLPLAVWSLRVAAAMLETPNAVTILPTASAAAMLAAVALVAAWIPARRAARIAPLDALRAE